METFSIDINCDVGEGIGNESELLPLISSCNIACGGHAGDSATMTEVALLAKQYHVKVGAHPSYPDTKNFGRVSMNITSDDLMKSIREQIKNFTFLLKKENISLHHIKAHGALYNDIAKDVLLAKIFLSAIKEYKEAVFLYVPYASVIATEAIKQNFKIKNEAFADRNYNTDLTLVSRKLPNAILEDPKNVLSHLLSIVKNNQVKTLNGSKVSLLADTFCIHGDTPSALQILMYLTQNLPNHNIIIKRE